MNVKATFELVEEHELLSTALDVMEPIAGMLAGGEAVPVGDLTAIRDFLQNFVQLSHEQKEEQVLFPALIKADESKKLIVSDLIGEHHAGRDYINGIAEALEAGYRPGNAEALHLSENFEHYARMFRKHIRRENGILFPEAERLIGADRLAELDAGFQRVQADAMTAEAFRACLRSVSELAARYLD